MNHLEKERLEKLSDNVRSGKPIKFREALEVIKYQEKIRKEKPIGFFKKIFKLLQK